MSTKTKTFDCVEMKNEIQRKLRQEWQGLTEAQIQERIQQDLEASDSPVGRLWRQVRAREEAEASRRRAAKEDSESKRA